MPYFLREKRLSGLFYLYTYTSQQHFEITNSLKDKCMRQNLRFKDHFRWGNVVEPCFISICSLCLVTPHQWMSSVDIPHFVVVLSTGPTTGYYITIYSSHHCVLIIAFIIMPIKNLYFYWYQLSNSCFRSNNHFILCWLLKIDDI